MEKVFITVLILSTALILSACGAQEAIKPEATSAPTQAPTQTPAPSPSAAVDDDSYGVPKEINGYTIFADIAILSDPPEGGIDMFEAMRRLSLEEDPITMTSVSDKSEFAYRYEGIIEIEGEGDECYEILLLMKDVNGEFSEGTDV